MKVSSPIGELPFKPEKLGLRNGALVVTGSMGAWPATIQIFPSDIPNLIRLLRWPLAAIILTATVVIFFI